MAAPLALNRYEDSAFGVFHGASRLMGVPAFGPARSAGRSEAGLSSPKTGGFGYNRPAPTRFFPTIRVLPLSLTPGFIRG
jgi:hypothetical protein